MAGSDSAGVTCFPDRTSNCSHVISHSSESEEYFQCPVCTDGPFTRSDLTCHMTGEHNECLVAVCKLCRQLYPPNEIQTHVLQCKGSYVCPHCRATFARPSYLQRHVDRQHSSGLRPVCDICGKDFSSSSALSYHKRSHTGEFPHSCQLCGALFAQSCHLKFHLDSHHAFCELYDTPKPFICKTCGRGFLFACSLKNHQRQHSKAFAQKFPCPSCGQWFSFRSELERHLATHSTKAVYRCPFCSQLFGRDSRLKAHILRHTNPAELTCPFCLQTYASRSYLVQHMEKHGTSLPIPSVSGCGTGSVEDIDCLQDNFGITKLHDTLLNEAFFTGCNDALHPDVNFLHAVLYGTDVTTESIKVENE